MCEHSWSPNRHSGLPKLPQNPTPSPKPLVTHLLSMRANSTLGPRKTLHTWGERSWRAHSPAALSHSEQGDRKTWDPNLLVFTQADTVDAQGRWLQRNTEGQATHLGPWSALLSRRSWFSLGSLETGNQAGHKEPVKRHRADS